MLNAKITGIASYVPDYVLTNDELSTMVDTNDEWITTRVGIKERRILHKENTGSSYMGAIAVQRLIENTGINPDDIELVICATSNPDYRFPSTASVITYQTGLKHCYAYDIQAACAGFIVALQDATGYIRSGLYRNVVVVCAEKMSSMVNYQDRQTCPLFGDGVLVDVTAVLEEVVPAVVKGLLGSGMYRAAAFHDEVIETLAVDVEHGVLNAHAGLVGGLYQHCRGAVAEEGAGLTVLVVDHR